VSDNNPPAADAELLQRYCGGEASAFDLLVERHQASLLRFAAGILRDPCRAEDVVQEVFMRLLRKTPVLGSGASAGPWLFRVCRNLAYDTMKMETREDARRDKLTPPERPDPGSDCEQQEVLSLVQREMQQLPQREREALWLKVHQGLSYAEIGEVLGVKPGTVGWLVHEGMNRLTARLRLAQAI
jgi:RNA polymerase sigma-70 factor (ECF subfamily)